MAGDTPVAEMGEVFEGKAARARFVLSLPDGWKNGKHPLRFGRVFGSCDCVEAELSSRAPGSDEPVYLDVTLHTRNLGGPKRYQIHTEVLEPDSILLEAEVALNVLPRPAPLLVRPPVFSWADDSVGARAEVELSNLSDTPLRVTGVAAEGGGVVLAGAASLALSPGSSRIIAVTRAAPAGDGAGQGKVVLHTDHPGYERMEIAVAE